MSIISRSRCFRQICRRYCSTRMMNCRRTGGRGSNPTEIMEQDRYSGKVAAAMPKTSKFRSLSDPVNGWKERRYLYRRKTSIDDRQSEMTGDINSPQLESLPAPDFANKQDELSLPDRFGKNSKPVRVERSNFGGRNSKYAASGTINSEYTEGLLRVEPFDICFSRTRNPGTWKPSLHEKEEEYPNNVERTIERTRQEVLRPGMVLLRHYIPHNCQVKIVKICRELGLGSGGFYRPGYQSGAKLRLQMMCLGLDWDPQTSKYGDRRRVDGCKAPGIPHEFHRLVQNAIQDAHSLIERDCKVSNVEDVLPAMSPEICIANFYATSGRLGLHQDRDESAESLRRGLPVVSFSIGDSAEFLYGDHRDLNKAEKVILESGDVLIFGGKSRHIFHGVSSIIPNSSPQDLLEEARLRPGRLNLTFRQY